MGVSGALFDIVKLLDVSKNIISKYSAEEIYNYVIDWSSKYNLPLKERLENDKEYATKIFNIERGLKKPRKDIAKWSDVEENISYMYDDYFYNGKDEYEFQKINDKETIRKIIKLYKEKYFDINDDKQMWFDRIKDLSEELGYAREVKEYKKEPDKYFAHVGDVSTVLRVALTKRHNTPDLYEIMQVLGEDRIIKRLDLFCK